MSYVIISIMCLILKKFYLHENIELENIIKDIIAFRADKYSWYVNMYIGLFLISPFLNALYDNIDRKNKKYLILILIFLTALPSGINNFIIKGERIFIFPDWWQGIYPLMYFFIGKYINEYACKYKKSCVLTFLLLTLLIESFLIYYFSYNTVFEQVYLNGYNNIFTAISSTCIFLLLYDIRIKNVFFSKMFHSIAKVSFEMYLVSFIFDQIFYKEIKLDFINSHYYFKYYFIYVPLVFLSSYILSLIINTIVKKFFVWRWNMKKVLIVLSLIILFLIFKKSNSNTYRINSNLMINNVNGFYKQELKTYNCDKVIIIGDSRMTLIEDNAYFLNIPSNFSFIALSGSKIKWLKEEAILNLEDKINNSCKYHVVLNEGVNDLNDDIYWKEHAREYNDLYIPLFKKYPNVNFYFLSVNPIDDMKIDKYWPNQKRTNKKINSFNEYLYHSFKRFNLENVLYCDSYNNIDFIIPDGLHYNLETDQRLLYYIANRCLKY